MQFFITLNVMFKYEIGPDQYFSQRQELRPDYIQGLDGIDKDDFAVLWSIIDSFDEDTPNRLFPKEFIGSQRCKRLAEVATNAMMDLFKGAKCVDVATDDLMVGARNKVAMQLAGLVVGYNNRKASSNGITVDIVTACPRLAMVIGFFLSFTDERADGPNRADKIVDCMRRLKGRGLEDVHNTLDRGFESTTRALILDGVGTTTTSQRGSPRTPHVPYIHMAGQSPYLWLSEKSSRCCRMRTIQTLYLLNGRSTRLDPSQCCILRSEIRKVNHPRL